MSAAPSLVDIVGFGPGGWGWQFALSELLTVGKNAASETKQYLGILCFTAAIYFGLTLISNLGFVLAERQLGVAYR